ncbi:unnamed protein product [Lampetra fluviatilis]
MMLMMLLTCCCCCCCCRRVQREFLRSGNRSAVEAWASWSLEASLLPDPAISQLSSLWREVVGGSALLVSALSGAAGALGDPAQAVSALGHARSLHHVLAAMEVTSQPQEVTSRRARRLGVAEVFAVSRDYLRGKVAVFLRLVAIGWCPANQKRRRRMLCPKPSAAVTSQAAAANQRSASSVAMGTRGGGCRCNP